MGKRRRSDDRPPLEERRAALREQPELVGEVYELRSPPPPPSPAVVPYARLPLAEKQARHREAMREPAIVCPFCEVSMGVPDALRHECSETRTPHPLEKWMSWTDVIEIGIPAATFHGWIHGGRVQVEGTIGHQRYRRRDVARMVLWWRSHRNGKG